MSYVALQDKNDLLELCVPDDWDDLEVQDFANLLHPRGNGGWRSLGDHCPCKVQQNHQHVHLTCVTVQSD